MKFFRRSGRDSAENAEQALNSLLALYRSGRYEEAEAKARSVAAAAARSRPRDDPYAPLVLSLAAYAADCRGRHAEALATFDAMLPVFGRIFGAEHQHTLKLRSDRQLALVALGRYEEAEAECAAVARIAARGKEPQSVLLAAAARNGLVFALNAQGRHPEAEAVAREALTASGLPDDFTLVLRLGLARSLNGQRRHEEALTEVKHAAELFDGLSEDKARPQTGAVELTVANALLGLGRTTEARARATAAHDACLAALGPDHMRTLEARTLLDRIDGT